MVANQIVSQNEGQMLESVLLGGDLSKLTSAQRVSYYQQVCKSLGLNPLTKPFSYIVLNGKMTLYATKDAADQLRNVHNVSIDDVDIKETDTQFIVKVKGHDSSGRSDVEVGVVNKTDMRGDAANAQMKAVTKGKRRLTLSLCGLGWLDETEVQTIPDAQPVSVTETGEIAVDPVDAPNPDPVKDRTWALYTGLCAEAKALGVTYSIPRRETKTESEIVELGKELRRYVEDARRQEKAGTEAQ